MRIDHAAVRSKGDSENQAAERQGMPLSNREVLFAVLLPIICLAGDFVLDFLPSSFVAELIVGVRSPIFVWCTTGLGILAVSASARPIASPPIQDVVRGTMLGTGILAALIGLAMLPLTLVGIALLIGALGFVPFGTAYVMLVRTEKVLSFIRIAADRKTVLRVALVSVAATGSIILPAALQFWEGQWVDRQIAELTSGSPARALAALDSLSRYPLRGDRGNVAACRASELHPDEATQTAIAEFLRSGTALSDYCYAQRD
jgi:hypothetical protein